MTALIRLLALLLAAFGLHAAGSSARLPDGVTSIEIHSAAGVSADVRSPTEVATIVNWFDALPPFVPRPCPYPVYAPPAVRFVFHGSGSARTTAVDRLPGTCSGEIEHGSGTALADDGFVARVSRLLGIDFDPNAKTAQNEAAAKLDARTVLGLARVPAGSRSLRTATSTQAMTALVDAHRTWKVRLPLARVLAFEKTHQPRGSSPTGSGTGSDHSVITSQQLMFSFPALTGRISSRLLNFDLVALRGGWTRIRVDAQDTWIVARSPSEKTPAGVREIVIHGPSQLARRITRREQVARVVRWFDALPVAQPGSRFLMCPLIRGPLVTIDFLGAGTTKLATASVAYNEGLSGACNPIAFSVDDRHEAPLVGGTFLRRVELLAR